MRKSILEWFAWGCLLCSSSAWADPDDTLNLIVGAGVMHDNNLFKAPAGLERSDEITTTTLGLNFDKEYSLQRIKVDASMTDYRYQDNDYLDYTGKNLNAAWLWKLSPSLYGNLSTSYLETMNSFADYRALLPERRRNLRTTKNSNFGVEWEAFGPLHLISNVSHYNLENSEVFVQESNYTAKTGEIGLKYVTSAQSSLSLVQRKSNGDYPREANPATLLDSGYEQSDTEARFIWSPTIKSTLFGRVSYLDRTYDHFSERNYAGYVGSLDFNWGATEKVSVLFRAARDLNVFQDPSNSFDSYSSYFKSDIFSVLPTWDITEKTRLKLRLSREKRDYEGTIVNGFPLREDRIKYLGATLEWDPTRNINVNLSYLKQSRDSNLQNFDYDSSTYRLSVILNF